MESDEYESMSSSGNQGHNDKSTAESTRCLMISPMKKLSALRLVSPIDTDQELIDLEVASVLADGKLAINFTSWESAEHIVLHINQVFTIQGTCYSLSKQLLVFKNSCNLN